ncbi:Pls/PosA family non-ribosomal peptide synthetase [Streptomyces sp. NPDC102467]|uniref:Pls/PosA family non-ribosomal peptide synthetase n=1 Tax=Streptomyces sp. NPDC102467 TaxID=3366179 RepID=UPI00382366F3
MARERVEDLPPSSLTDADTDRAVPLSRVTPPSGSETALAEVLADVLRVERVSVDDHFFDDLGSNSLTMAHFCARVRKLGGLPAVSMKDVYRHPTIRRLASALADVVPATAEPQVPAPVAQPVGTPTYLFCGTLQLLVFLSGICLTALLMAAGYTWMKADSGVLDTYVRSVLFGTVTYLGLCALPIAAKWMLIGRWKPQEFRIWSLAYVRFWCVRTLVRSNPLALFAGSPLYVLYLRALGAKVGAGVTILSRQVPVCTDLLTIGDGTVIGKDSSFTCYRAHGGLIQTGTVTFGKDVFVSEGTVLDIETALGDGAQLGHASSLHPGQSVPAGEHWHGSPAQRTEVNHRMVAPADCGTTRRATYATLQLLSVLVVYLPLAIGSADLLLSEVPQLSGLLTSGRHAFGSWTFYRDVLAVSFVLFFGSVLVGLAIVTAVPRVLDRVIEPDKVYRLYGVHHWVHRTIAAMTNNKFFTGLFGDSSYIVHYLRALGYDLCRVEQTGSNFGTGIKHESPYLSIIGSGTMVADGLSIMNADYSSTSFRLSHVSIGAHNFLGNSVLYPAQGKTGVNCLLATKVMVPINGDVREGVGLLGSPSFEIPRSVERDARFDHLRSGDMLHRKLATKNRYNLRTMGLYLLVRWIRLFVDTLIACGAVTFYPSSGVAALGLATILALLFGLAYSVLLERAVNRFRRQSPQFCSIYQPYFWRHERFWKLHATPLPFMDGTPFKSLFWRALGMRLGRRLFDDGCDIPERSLVTIGDDCTLNAGSGIQCHSQEDGTFKSDRTTIGAGSTLGVGALVHYGVTMQDGAVLAPDSFLMKGEDVPQQARWGGNPAREMREHRTQPACAATQKKP